MNNSPDSFTHPAEDRAIFTGSFDRIGANVEINLNLTISLKYNIDV
jgi:hypothetical protein